MELARWQRSGSSNGWPDFGPEDRARRFGLGRNHQDLPHRRNGDPEVPWYVLAGPMVDVFTFIQTPSSVSPQAIVSNSHRSTSVEEREVVSTQQQPSVWRAPSRISFVACSTCGKAMKTVRVQRPTPYSAGFTLHSLRCMSCGHTESRMVPGQKP